MTDYEEITVEVDSLLTESIAEGKGVPSYQVRLASEQARDRIKVDHPDESVRYVIRGALMRMAQSGDNAPSDSGHNQRMVRSNTPGKR